MSQNRASHIAVECHPTNHILNVPLVHFLKKKEAHFLDKQKQCIIYMKEKPHSTNDSLIVPLLDFLE